MALAKGRVSLHPRTLVQMAHSECETKARASEGASALEPSGENPPAPGKRFRLIECLAALARALYKYLAEAHQNMPHLTIDASNDSSLLHECELDAMMILLRSLSNAGGVHVGGNSRMTTLNAEPE